MGKIGADRAKALKLALENIDKRPKNEFPGKEDQDLFLGRLIEINELKDFQNTRTGRKVNKGRRLTVEVYRQGLVRMLNEYGKQIKSKKATVGDLFRFGSEVIAGKYLEALGHEKQSIAEDSEDEGDGNGFDGNWGSENEADEVDSDGAGTFNPTRAVASTPKRTTTAQSLDNTVESSNASLEVRSPGERLAAPPTFPLSAQEPNPDCEEEPLTKKRKLSAQIPLSTSNQRIDVADLKVSSKVQTAPPEFHRQEEATRGEAPAKPQKMTTLYANPVLLAKAFDPTAGLVKLSDSEIMRSMEEIWNDIQDISRKMMRICKVGESKRGALVLEPQPQLEEIYRLLFGANWRRKAQDLIADNGFTARAVIEACVGATAYKWGLQPCPPWKTPEQVMESIAPNVAEIDRVLGETEPGLRVHTVVWQAGRNQSLEAGFLKTVIRPYAEKMAETFMLMIIPQLEAISTRGILGSSRTGRRNLTEEITTLFCKMVRLRGAISAAPDYYSTRWPKSGEERTTGMEMLHEGPGTQEVLYGVSPMIKKRSKRNAAWVVVCPAKIFSRRMEDEETT